MKEFKGTPGNWGHDHRLCRDGNYRTQVFCSKGIEICTLSWYPTQTIKGVTKTYREPNARLIATAPDLLFALQEITEHLDSIKQYSNDDYYINQAQLAITKALGE